jgi:hypothetical protein
MLKAIKATNLIDSLYEGGFDQFMKDHGAVCYVPEPMDKLYVVHPDLPEDIKKKLTKAYGKNIEFGTTWNFDGFTDTDYETMAEAIKDGLSATELDYAGIVANPCVFGITAPENSINDEVIDQVIDKLRYLPLLIRGCVVCKDGFKTFVGANIESEQEAQATGKSNGSKPRVKISTVNRPERDKAINDDDITNLIIAMNSAGSIEEFLEQV